MDQANTVYARTITEWAAISEGAFAPTDILERWDSPTGPVHVTFRLPAGDGELRPAYLADWIDPRILVPLNTLIAGSGRQFEIVRVFDQTAIVLALTPAEKHALEVGRGWCFEWPWAPQPADARFVRHAVPRVRRRSVPPHSRAAMVQATRRGAERLRYAPPWYV